MKPMDVEKLAQLAGLDLKAAEQLSLTPQLAEITGFCSDLPMPAADEVAVPEVVAPAPDTSVVARPLERQVALDNVPQRDGGLIIVPSPLAEEP